MSPRQEQRAAASWAEAQRASEQMAHARQAAREITHERTESARVVGGVAGAAHEEGQPQPQHVEVHRGGILETVQQGASLLVSTVSPRSASPAGTPPRSVRSPSPRTTPPGLLRERRSRRHAAEKAKNGEDTAERSREEKLLEYKRPAAGVVSPAER